MGREQSAIVSRKPDEWRVNLFLTSNSLLKSILIHLLTLLLYGLYHPNPVIGQALRYTALGLEVSAHPTSIQPQLQLQFLQSPTSS